VALTAKQVAQLAAGRYAGTGVSATWTLGANTTVSGQLAIDNGILSANGLDGKLRFELQIVDRIDNDPRTGKFRLIERA